ncbi:MAG: hypothetical protein ACHQF0_03425 [Chitinophagales bacterium]
MANKLSLKESQGTSGFCILCPDTARPDQSEQVVITAGSLIMHLPTGRHRPFGKVNDVLNALNWS